MGDSNSVDPALQELFRAEMDTHLPVLSEGLLALEKGRAGEKDLEGMMRAAHSIKGAARIVGIEAAVRFAHVMEDCFSAAQGGRVALGSESVDVLLQGVDALQKICSPQSEAPMTEEAIQALLDRIAAVRDGQSSPPLRGPSQVATVTPVIVEPATRTAAARPSRVSLPAVLDADTAESLRVELSNTLCQSPSRILLDFAQVRSLSASALSLLASFAHETSRAEAAIAVDATGVSADMVILLRTTGLDRTIHHSE